MKNRSAGLAIVCALFGSSAAAQAPYVLVWEDEFDGTQLDTQYWTPLIGTGTNYGLPAGWGNNELQYYTDRPQNIVVADGMLTIVARRENYNGSQYTSARIRTQGKFDFTYGRIEARMKLPSTQGIWPALWMMPTNSPYGGWAAGGEIDIMESTNIATTVHGTLHFGGQWPENTSAGGSYGPGINFSNDFHTYTCEWTPDTIRWYVDGNLYRSLSRANWWSNAAPDNDRAPFDQNFHLLLNCAVGGNWPGGPNGSSQFPQQYQIDWVRVYRQEQAPYGGTPTQIPGTLESERFDEGYPGEAYRDCTLDNQGGAFRTNTDVDIEAASGGGFNVGYICTGEWLEYTVDVAYAGEYEAVARVASEQSTGRFVLEVDGSPVSDPVDVPSTGGWQTYTEISFPVTLDAGQQVLRFRNVAFSGGEFNIDRIEFVGECLADVNQDGSLSPADFSAWIAAFNANAPECDQNSDGACTPADFTAWIANYNAGCD